MRREPATALAEATRLHIAERSAFASHRPPASLMTGSQAFSSRVGGRCGPSVGTTSNSAAFETGSAAPDHQLERFAIRGLKRSELFLPANQLNALSFSEGRFR